MGRRSNGFALGESAGGSGVTERDLWRCIVGLTPDHSFTEESLIACLERAGMPRAVAVRRASELDPVMVRFASAADAAHATAAGTVDLSPAIGALVGRAPGCAVPPGDVDWAQLEGSAGFASAVSGAATSRSALAETAFGLSGIKHPSTPFSGRGSVFGGASSFGRASGSTAFGRSTRPRLGATTASGGKAFMPRAFNSSAGFRTGGSAAGLGEDLSYPGVRGSLAESPGLLGCLCRLWAIVGGGSM